MPQIEESKKEASKRTRKWENQMISLSQKKMAGRLNKQKSSSTTAEIFKSNGYRDKSRGKKMRKRVKTEKWSGGRRIARRVNQIWQKSKIRWEKFSNVKFKMRQDSVKKDK